MKKVIAVLCLASLLVLTTGCGEADSHHSDVASIVTAPDSLDLQLTTDDSIVSLTWNALPEAAYYTLTIEADGTNQGTYRLDNGQSRYTDSIQAGATYRYRLEAIDTDGNMLSRQTTAVKIDRYPSPYSDTIASIPRNKET